MAEILIGPFKLRPSGTSTSTTKRVTNEHDMLFYCDLSVISPVFWARYVRAKIETLLSKVLEAKTVCEIYRSIVIVSNKKNPSSYQHNG